MSRVALITAEAPGSVSGNTRTLRRLQRSLEQRGVEASEVSLHGRSEDEVLSELGALRPALLHAFHAYKAGRAARRLALELEAPFVVFATGTDLHRDAADPARGEEVVEVLAAAAAVLVNHAGSARPVLERLKIAPALIEVPKGVELPPAAEARPADAGEVIFLLPAGWREVKNNLFPLEPLAGVAREAPSLRLRFLGPVLDPAYRARFEPARFPFAVDGGVVPLEAMGDEYRRAAVVLNVSHAEGAANAVLEAMAWGRAVLASDIGGNRALVDFDDGRWEASTGLLYRVAPAGASGPPVHDALDFARKARRLALDPALRAALGRNARRAAGERHSPEAEVEAVLGAYRLCGL